MASLPPTRAQSRYGVGFVRTLCAQAGYGLSETSPDEDTLAVDCSIETPAAPIRVQVKCTTAHFSKKLRVLNFHVADHWRSAWAQNIHDLYFVVVRLQSSAAAKWVAHPDDYTHHRAIGYWTRIKPQEIPASIRVAEAQRLTHTTFQTWEHELMAKYGVPGVNQHQ